MDIRKTAILLAMSLSLSGCYLRDSEETKTSMKNNVPDEEVVVLENISENTNENVQVPEILADSPAEPVAAMHPTEEPVTEPEPEAETESEETISVPETENTAENDSQLIETEPESVEVPPPAPDYNTTVYITVNVKARYNADQNSEYNGVINAGMPVLVTDGIKDGWNEVQYNGDVYYVSSEWLRETYTAPETEPVIEPEETFGEPEAPDADAVQSENNVSGLVQSISLDKTSVEIAVGLSDMPWVTMLPADAADKSEIWTSSDESIATVDRYGRILGISPGQCTVTVTSGVRPDLSVDVNVTVYSGTTVTEPTYIDGVLIVNKSYQIPETYNPGVDPTAQTALDALIAGAALDGVNLWVKSGFRSYETQKTLYNNYVARDGKDEADRYSARPGHSEHQTGLAFDLNSLEQSFGETKEGIWLADHCMEYGFIIRYPAGKEEITGYMYEPWHIRYIGEEKAKLVAESGLCLEEYFGISSYYGY